MLDYSKSTKETSQTILCGVHIPKIFEKKIREYPTLQPTNINTTKIPSYKERESPFMHVEKVSRNIGENG